MVLNCKHQLPALRQLIHLSEQTHLPQHSLHGRYDRETIFAHNRPSMVCDVHLLLVKPELASNTFFVTKKRKSLCKVRFRHVLGAFVQLILLLTKDVRQAVEDTVLP